jgi:hypothetical protein
VVFTGFWWGNLRERDHLGDRGLDGRIILRCMFRKWDMDWIDVARYRDKWWAAESAVSEPSGSTKCGEFLD